MVFVEAAAQMLNDIDRLTFEESFWIGWGQITCFVEVKLAADKPTAPANAFSAKPNAAN
ncbi:hypothetical protein BH10CYA1_BH10CYA1_03530 [soil metagenome]